MAEKMKFVSFGCTELASRLEVCFWKGKMVSPRWSACGGCCVDKTISSHRLWTAVDAEGNAWVALTDDFPRPCDWLPLPNE